MKIRVKRVYEPAEKSDGIRILVDRLWPRGIEKGRIDLWLKDIAPSNTLRKWYGHVPERWNEFRKRYLKELESNETGLRELVAAAKGKTLTLLYGARDTEHNQAEIILEFLKKTDSANHRQQRTKASS